MTEPTDRELLSLAAKAAGIDVYESNDGTIQDRPVLVFSAGGGMGTMPYEERWNPIADDAQALRLAVKLRIDLDLWIRTDWVTAWNHMSGGISLTEMPCAKVVAHHSEPKGDDEYGATRRAVVRAAAEIGKAMQ